MSSYSKDSTILPIPELVAKTKPKTLSPIVTDLKSRRQTGFKKETFGELLKTVGVPMPVLPPEKLFHLGCPAALGGAVGEVGRDNQIAQPNTSGFNRNTEDKGG